MSDIKKRLQSLSPEQREQLLRQLKQESANTAKPGTRAPIARLPRTGAVLPTSFAQQRMWFLDQLEPGSAAYSIPLLVRMQGTVDVAVLERCLAVLVERHESLRTTFRSEDGKPVQDVAAAMQVPLAVVDLRGVDASVREAELKRVAGEELRRPFDLAQGPLVRAMLLRVADDDQVFLMAMHHIVTDGWSMGVLIRELVTLYGALSVGNAPPLEALPLQYADYAAWQREYLRGEVLEKQLGWWREQLKGAPTGLELPTDRPRPAAQSLRGSSLPVRLPKALSESLKALAQKEGATPFMLLLSAFQALLSRYSGQDDVVVGTPVAGRTRAETEGVVGLFVNTLALRTKLDGEQTFRELLGRVRETTLGAFAHQDVPFEKLVEELQPERDRSRPPFFQVMFILQNTPASAARIAGVTLTPMDADTQTSKFDLSLALTDTADGFAGGIDYCTDLFDGATVQRLAGHFQALLSAAVAAPDRSLRELSLLPADERRQLDAWNATGTTYSIDCLHRLFEAQAARTPDATAVVFEDQQLTYRQLDERANQLAHHLRSLGVGPEVRVALALERSLDLVVAIYATLKAGGAYVPLEPTNPRDRLAFMLGDCAPAVLLTTRALRQRLPESSATTLYLDALPPEVASLPAHAPDSGVQPQHLAYVIYTSGSTGLPKGAMNAHAGVANRLLWMQQAYGLTASDTVLQKTPYAFDVSVWEFFWPLLTGARLVLARPGGHQDPAYLARLIQQQSVTALHFVPSMLAAFLDEETSAACTSVRLLVCSGEALPAELASRSLATLPGAALHNLYGPTEAAVDVTAWHVRPGSFRASVPIGVPVANTQIHLLDASLQPVPVGIPGELFIAGVQVGRGYLSRPDLTAERFIPDPFSSTPGARMYRTGDLARRLPDGSIDYLGRLDFQVKLRGFRIELGEIESALAQHPTVRDAVLMAREDVPGDKRLVAYVTARQGQSIDVEALRKHLGASLPEYMVPSAFVVLEVMPLSANGKADRKALPAPAAPTRTAREFVAPRNPTEELLAGLFSQLLNVSRVGVNDDFFALGGHSLMATQLASRLRRTFGVELPLRELFEAPTVAALALRVEAASRAGQGVKVPAMQPVSRTGPLPLSFAQQRLWFLDQLEPGTPTYNLPVALRMEGSLDVDALERAFTELVRRHESLRTTFASVDGKAVQVITPPAPVRLERERLTFASAAEREEGVQRLATEESRRPFDLGTGPLLRVRLVQVDTRDHVLLVTMHHIVSDGWSMGVLVREVVALYEAFQAGRPSPLPELPVQYADYAAWQRAWLSGNVLEGELSWWTKQLAGISPVLPLPTDFPRPAVRTGRGASLTTRLPAEVSAAVRAYSQREGVTPFMTLMAAFQLVLARWSGQTDIVVGTDIANRNRAEAEGLIGFFINQLALRTDVSAARTFRELVSRVRDTTLAAYAHQDVPFDELVRVLNPERSLGHAPIFQVKLVLQNAPMSRVELPELVLRQVDSVASVSRFDITLSLTDTPEGFACLCEYSTDLFEAGTIHRLIQHLGTVLGEATARPELAPLSVPLLPTSERATLLDQWSGGIPAAPWQGGAHERFAAQAERTPDAIALTFGEQRITYRELNARANQLAWHLRARGVGPDMRVAICFERSPELIVAMLGVLKAGGAWLPLDPSYPADRLAYMLTDAAAPVLVTTGALADELPSPSGMLVCVDEEADELAACRADAPPPTMVLPEHLAYVIYTSGSTGRPKGTLLTHAGLCNTALAAAGSLELGPDSRVLQFAASGFDASVWEIFSTLLVGGRLCLAPQQELLPGEALHGFLAREGVTAVTLTPTALAPTSSEGLPALKTVTAAGEASTPELARRWSQGRRFINAYGPTEVTICATLCRDVEPERLSIGGPLAGVRVYVLDASLQLAPVGVPGELYVGGVGLARGYLGRPELTAERFVPNPFATTPGERLYRTGDVVRWRTSGELEFVGRADTQVKIRGFRIELGEIESALSQHPEVEEAVVVVRDEANGQRRLVAYLTPRDEAAPETAKLRAFLKERLPEYMVPATFVTLEAFPLSPAGKVDRLRLPAPEGHREEGETPFAAPRDERERVLADIWQQVLGRERVGIHDNFFDLGGDSIIGLQVVARARQAGLVLDPREIFKHQTVEALARVATEARGVSGEQGPVTGPVPLTPIQHAFFELEAPEPHHYNQAVLLEVHQPGLADAAEKALQAVLEHHDALRLRFERTADGWKQVNAGTEGRVELRRVDLSAVPEAGQAEAIAKVAAEVQASVDLSSGVLLKAAWIERGAGRTARLLWVLHHHAVDGVSWRVLLEDFSTALGQAARGDKVSLPPKTTSFKAWAEKLVEHARSEKVEAERAFWEEQARVPVRPLPLDKAGGENTVALARSVSVSLDAEETGVLLREVPSAWRARLDDVLLAALANAVKGWTGEGAVRVDLEGHGRDVEVEGVDVSRTVGWFTSVHPVVLALPEGGTLGDGLRAVRDTLRAVPGRGQGFGLLRYLGREESQAALRAMPRAEIAFNYLGQLDATAKGSALLGPAAEGSGAPLAASTPRTYKLEVNGLVLDGRLQVSWTYGEQFHERATIESLAQAFLASLRALIAARGTPDARRYTPSDFPLARLDAATLERVVPAGTEVEDVYALSPMQQGLLFHATLAPDADEYLEQVTWKFHSGLDLGALRRTWEALLARHASLRSGFVWEGLPEPVQVVAASAPLPWTELDWRDMAPEAQQERWQAFLAEDRKKGFDLTRPPLMRMAVVRLTDDVHAFVWSHHHLIMDGWSLGVLLRELFPLYDAMQAGRALPELGSPPPYRDYIAWVRQQDPAQAENWWRKALAGFKAPTPLPGIRPAARAGGAYPRLLEKQLEVDGEAWAALQAFARQHQLTINTIVQGAWALLLSRYSGAKDVAFGATLSGRPAGLGRIEEMVGLFINSLPVRVRLPDDAQLVPWLKELQAWQVDMRAYEHSPLVQVQGWSDVRRGLPLFDSLFVFENYPIDTAVRERTGALEIRDAEFLERKTYPLDLTVVASRTLKIVLACDEDRLEDPGVPGRLLEQMRVVLAGMAARPTQQLAELSLLAEPERSRLLVDWNQSQYAFPAESCFSALFEAQVERTPDAVAVEFQGKTLTYRELNARANRQAHALMAMGIGPDRVVALLDERGPQLLTGILAVFKAGGAYIPLDPNHPPARIAQVLEQAGAPVALASSALMPLLEGAASLLPVERQPRRMEFSALTDGSDQNPMARSVPRNLAYIIFTSGSTGAPKGAMVDQLGMVNHLYAKVRDLELTGEDIVAQTASQCFDISVWQFLIALVLGGRTIILEDEIAHSPPALLDTLEALDVTIVETVPSLLRALLDEADDRGERRPSLSKLRWMVPTGEALPPDLCARWFRHYPNIPLINAYGPTECSDDVTHHVLRDVPTTVNTPVGRPVANMRSYVLDALLQPVPVGVAGELFIGGTGVGRGYVGRPDLTAERFIPDAFSTTPGERLYRTGDLARWLADGTIEFLGRIDHQVKVRGFRIELGEIEVALSRQPGVSAAVVVAREDVPGDKRLVAYVVQEPGHPSTMADLRSALEQRLPEYMVPSAFVRLDAFPLNSNGKVDRAALPAPEAGSYAERKAYVAPRTPTEELMAGLWAQVLRLDRVSMEDDFFELGGHSLMAMQLVSRIRAAFQVELPVRELFESLTVAKLALRVEALKLAGSGAQPPALVAVPRTGELALSFGQQRLWFLAQLEPDSPFYNVAGAVRMEGALDVAVLERSFAELARRHESLRTTFHSEGGRPVQLISPEGKVPVELHDLRGLPAEEREAAARRLSSEVTQRPFNLETGPLMRAALVRMADEDHVLLVTMHHIVSDGWSVDILVRETAALYDAFMSGRQSPLPELPLQYVDFAAWQQSWLKDDVLEAQLGWWRNQLAGAPRALELPTDRPRPAVQTFHGASLPVRLPLAVSEALRTFCLREGVTPFMVLLSAFEALLSRYSGQDDVVVGTPIAGRNRAEMEGVVGLFINTLALRLRVGQAPSFRALVAQAREVTLGAFSHQDVPFEKLVEAVQPARDLGRTPLFQVLFALQNVPASDAEMTKLKLRALDVEVHTARFDLELNLVEGPEGIVGAFIYNTDLFDAATVERMGGHLHTLLEGALARPDAPLAELPLLAKQERQRVLVEWNDTRVAFPGDSTLHALFEEHVAQRPDAVALESASEKLTYRQLDERANQLAHALRRMGVGPDARVALCLERSVDLIVCVLGILKAGGAYVPLDASYPQERLALMVEDARPQVLVTTRSMLERLPTASMQLLLLDEARASLAQEPTSAPSSGATARNLAYIDFTSGSTGRPKGVCIEHRSVARLVKGVDYAELGPQHTFLLIAPISFDASTLEIWGCLLNGGRLVLFPAHAPSDVRELREVLTHHAVTTLHLTAGLFSQMVDADIQGLASVRQLLTGGDVVSAPHVRRVLSELKIPVTACYGPTESTTFTSCFRMTEPSQPGNSVPIGRPIANTQVYLLDGNGQPVPAGVPGELFVGGDGLARGYLHADLTAERFVPNPFSNVPGARLYRTGDLARWRHDGVLEFLGRGDTQVKVRGYRVEPSEVEAALQKHPGVRECVVVARPDGAGGKRLVAYVSGGTPAPTVAELRSFLAQRLPEYMVPAAFMVLDALPLTPNGKVDRRALPDLGNERPELEQGYLAPRTPTEEKLAGLWAEVLGVERVGIHDGFFELGGHSLLATQVVSRMRAAWGVELPLRELFESPTIASLASKVDAGVARLQGDESRPMRKVERTGELPLSFAQQRLWFIDQMEPGNTLYNIPMALRLEGELDVAALDASFVEIFRRHEALRTTFARGESGPVQRIQPAPSSVLRVEDVSALGGEEQQAEVRRRVEAEIHKPFDLDRGPLLRCTVMRLGEREHVLVLTMHHIISDAWSTGVLIREMMVLYPALRAGQAAPLPELALQYADYAVWQRERLQGEALEQQIDWWRKQLAGAPSHLEMPLDRPRPAVQTSRGEARTVVLPKDLAERLSALAVREGVTPFMLLLAAFQVLLSRYSGQDDVSVGTPIAGRNRAETEALIGFFVNTLVLRTKLDGEPTFRELLARVRETTLGAYAHQDVPFEKLVEAVQPVRDLSRSPLFQAVFVLQNAPAPDLELPGLTLHTLEAARDSVKYDLTLTMVDTARGLATTLEYNTDLFERTTADRMLGHLRTLLEAVVS
ncbi:non-ribosomal peptide synthase/polyketide synthase, partial [Myxococcus sp. RHSTA-1-4]|uniref:non-ribosomal peptide synthase/polyketide synthase n=1 Tax=Myxococcus sp. RHSTA-1-4 TaxID=2874601 RepID=UPI001CBBB038